VQAVVLAFAPRSASRSVHARAQHSVAHLVRACWRAPGQGPCMPGSLAVSYRNQAVPSEPESSVLCG